MFLRLQAAGALLLLVLATVLGHASFAQCLCTGKVALVAEASDACGECCSHEEAENLASGGQSPAPAPCEDHNCLAVLSFDATEPQLLEPTAPLLAALTPPTYEVAEIPFPRPSLTTPPRTDHPPGSSGVPKSVLYSSFLL